jgi:predicted RNase H-like HicB family nuclease
MSDYPIIIERLSDEDGGGYIARVPDLPGCFADGETDAEALANAHDAIACWIDHARARGQFVPDPSPQKVYA